MKKLAAFLLCFMFIINLNTYVYAIADSAECACVVNGMTGEVVFSKNINKRHAMASTTKIMTAIVAIERSRMDEVVTVSANAANQEGSAAYVEENMEIYMRDLLYGLMLNSGNDAAVAIAEHIAGSTEGFVDLMNQKAEEIGARGTNFVNPNGLYDEAHFTTAADLALIARYAMQNPQFREIVRTATYEATLLNSQTPLYFSNHNKLLSTYEGSTGIKTGYTELAGRCLVSSAMRDGMEFIAVTLDDPNDWDDHAAMLDYAFSQYYPKKLIRSGTTVKVAKIDGIEYNMVADGDFIMPFRENGKTEVEVVTHIAKELVSPVNAGEKMGFLEVRVGGRTVGEVDVVSESNIYNVSSMRLRNSFYGTFRAVLRRIFV